MLNRKFFLMVIILCFLGSGLSFTKEKKNTEEKRNIEFVSKVDKTQINKNDTLKLEIILKFEGRKTPKIKLPEFKDFKILARFQSQSMNIVQGKLEYIYKLTLLLLPKKSGELVIPPVKAKIRFKEFSTKPIKIKVAPPKEEEEEEIIFEKGISV